MCYETSQLAFRIYKEAVRLGAPAEEIERLKKKWEKLKGGVNDYYHTSGFEHAHLVIFNKERELELSQWGLIPHWVKDEKTATEICNKTLNARGETIFEKPSFEKAAHENRCILPLDGFFEYFHKKGKRFPYFVRAKNGARLMVGALKSHWTDPVNGNAINSFSIVTSGANDVMQAIHNNPKLAEPRMPLILGDEEAKIWLNGNESDVKKLIQPNFNVKLESYTVGRTKGKNYLGNNEKIHEPFGYPELYKPPTLFD